MAGRPRRPPSGTGSPSWTGPISGCAWATSCWRTPSAGPSGRWTEPEIGVVEIALTPKGLYDPVFGHLPEVLLGLQWHGAAVERAPARRGRPGRQRSLRRPGAARRRPGAGACSSTSRWRPPPFRNGPRCPNTRRRWRARVRSAASLERAVRDPSRDHGDDDSDAVPGDRGLARRRRRSPMTTDAESATAQLAPDVVRRGGARQDGRRLAARGRAPRRAPRPLRRLGRAPQQAARARRPPGGPSRRAGASSTPSNGGGPTTPSGARRVRAASPPRSIRIRTSVSVRRRRGALPGGVRAAAVRALSPAPAAADGRAMADAAGLGGRVGLGVRMHRPRRQDPDRGTDGRARSPRPWRPTAAGRP